MEIYLRLLHLQLTRLIHSCDVGTVKQLQVVDNHQGVNEVATRINVGVE